MVKKLRKVLGCDLRKLASKITIYAIFTQKRYNFVSALASEFDIV